MELLLLLLTAHFVADFYLPAHNGNKALKANSLTSSFNWKHASMHGLINIVVFVFTSLALPDSVMVNVSFLAMLTFVVITCASHLLTDNLKLHQNNELVHLLAVQTIHILLICLLWSCISDFTLQQVNVFFSHILTAKNMVLAVSYILICKPASVIIALALKKHTDSLNDSDNAIEHKKAQGSELKSEENSINVDLSTPNKKTTGLLSAGAWIGYIERCLAISFIFMGQFAGIGFLVATKTIFRFGDLTKNKDMKLTEYMMLGTLLSYAIAIFVGWNALQIYKTL
jgi:hypothetical protein